MNFETVKHLKYLNKFIWKHKWRFILGVLFISCSNIFTVIMPQIVKRGVNLFQENINQLKLNGFSESLVDNLVMGALGLAGLYILMSLIKGFFTFLNRQTIIVMSRLIEFDLKNEIYQHYQKLNQSFYKKNRTGDLMNRISEDVSRVRMYLGPAIMYSINLVVLFIMVISTMVNMNPELTIYVLMPLPIMSVLIYYVSKTMNRQSERVQIRQSSISTFVQESLSGIRVLKGYNKEKLFNKKFEEESNLYKTASLQLVRTNALFLPVIVVLIGLSTILTIYIGGMQVINNEGITLGDLAAFIIYINLLTWPVASLGWVTSLTQRAAASQKRINEFLEVKPEIVNNNTKPTKIKGNVHFKNVSFTYPDSGIEALKNISFKINQGETLGIIGETGCGKTTIANLLGRLYDCDSGTVLIDDIPIKELNLDNLRDSIGLVPQDVFLFSDTIRNNIKFGVTEASDEEIVNATKNAHIHHNIENFEEGYDTLVGERGVTLSGGQKQRISIARAIIKKPQILIFDDSLSAVDTETEEIILNNLKKVMHNKTSVVISHKISSVKYANQIIVLKEGKILEQGTHQELMKLNGYYNSLYYKQTMNDEVKEG